MKILSTERIVVEEEYHVVMEDDNGQRFEWVMGFSENCTDVQWYTVLPGQTGSIPCNEPDWAAELDMHEIYTEGAPSV